VIILDAFTGYTIPRQLITSEAAQAYRRILKPGGLIAINFIAGYRSLRTTLAHELSATFKTAFDSVQIFPAGNGCWTHAEQNLLLVCAEHEPNVDYLRSAAVSLMHAPPDAVLYDELPR
jgi:spermidine synthase